MGWEHEGLGTCPDLLRCSGYNIVCDSDSSSSGAVCKHSEKSVPRQQWWSFSQAAVRREAVFVEGAPGLYSLLVSFFITASTLDAAYLQKHIFADKSYSILQA